MPKLMKPRYCAQQAGVGLVEVLAALFVLSVGLLGIAGLQAQGLRAGYSASQRSIAVMKAYEIIERMRANPNAVRDGNGNTFYAAGFAFDPAGAPNPFCADTDSSIAADCTDIQLANYDIWVWKESIDSSFKNMNGQGAIGVNLGATWNAPTTVTVTVQWQERGVQQQYVTQTQFVRTSPN